MARSFDAIVIGSGLGGLVAGATFASQGRRVLVLEKNASLGGAMGVFANGPLTIEASLHELDGLDDGDPKLPVIRSLGLEGLEFVRVPELYEVRSRLLGDPFVLPHGVDEAIEAGSSRFPHRARELERYLRGLERLRSTIALALAHRDERAWWALGAPLRLPRLAELVRSMRLSLADVQRRRFGTDEAVKLALTANLQYYADRPDRLWYPFFAAGQGSYHLGGGNYVRGGSTMLAAQLAARIEAAGGETETDRRVVGLLVEDGRVHGVEHEAAGGGERRQERAPIVFGGTAPHSLADMLPEGARRGFLRPYVGRPLSLTIWTLAVGLDRPGAELGLRAYSTWVYPDWMRSLDDVPRSGGLLASDPDGTMPHYVLTDYSRIDAGLPQPPYLASMGGLDLVANWDGLSEAAARDRRARWADALIGLVDRQFPGFADAVVHWTFLPAVSNRNYLGTPDGALYGFAPEPPRWFFFRPETPLRGLWLASAFGGLGGYSGAFLTGWRAAVAALKNS